MVKTKLSKEKTKAVEKIEKTEAEEATAVVPKVLQKPVWVDQFVWDKLTEEGKKAVCEGKSLNEVI